MVVFILAIGITGLLSYLNSQYVVSDLANQLQNEVSDRIEQHLDTYLETPHLINQLCLDSIRLGELNTSDNTALQRHFQELSYRYNTIESVCYANEREGNYTIISSVGAPGIAHGSDRFLGFSRASTNFSFEEYRIDKNGTILEQTLSKSKYDPRTRPWYTSAVHGPAWTPIYMWLEGVVSQDAVLPVYSNGRLRGVLDTSLTLTGIGDFLQRIQLSKNGQAFIIEKSGLLVASSTIKEPYSRVNDTLVRLSGLDYNDAVVQNTTRYLMQIPLQDLTARYHFTFDVGGKKQYVMVTPYQDQYGLDWLIVVVIPESDFMEKIATSNQTTMFLIISSIVGATIISLLLARWITQPILSMNHSAKALAKGDWNSFSEIDREDELGELSHSFRLMADQLRAAFLSVKISEERYLSLFQSSPDAILLFEDDVLLNMNKAGEEMFHLSERDAAGKNVKELFGEMGSSIEEMLFSPADEQGGHIDRTISRTVEKTEQFLNIRLTHVPVEGKLLHLVQIRDITDERRAIFAFAEQKALRESYSQIEMILQLLPDPTFVINADGYVLFWNKALEKMTGVSADDVIGKGKETYTLAIHKADRPLLVDIVLHPNPEIKPTDLYPDIEVSADLIKASVRRETPKGVEYCSVIAARLYDQDGHIFGAIESIRDITSYKLAEEALLIANKKLNLLSSVTRHDILNKITVSKGYLFLLEETLKSEDQIHAITATNRALGEIEHFVAFTKAYQEIGLKAPIWQNVPEVFTHAVQAVDTRDVAVHLDLPEFSIMADPLFEKVCYNLIENAIRHGEHLTRIDITAGETEEGMRISVTDDGIGVPDDLKEKIFERGFGKNTGFGLFLSREILSLTGISITERGTSGSSCRFDIDLPAGKFRWER